MVVTCNLRNEDSNTGWYLIQAQVNTHEELSFHHVARPAIDIQTERTGVEYSEFWAPIRRDGPFAGKPVPVRNDGWITKSIRGASVSLELHNHACYVSLGFQGDDRIERREKALGLFPATDYKYELCESSKYAGIRFPVVDKGRKDREHWPEMREKLTAFGSKIYERIKESEV